MDYNETDHLIDTVPMPMCVWRDKNINPTEKILLTDITGLVRKYGKCFKGNEAFSELLCLSKNRVSKIISDLKSKGYIEVFFDRGVSENIEKRHIILSESYIKSLIGGIGENDKGYWQKRQGGIGENDKGGIGENDKYKRSIDKRSIEEDEELKNSSISDGMVKSASKKKSHPAFTKIVKFFCEEYWPDYSFRGSIDGKQVNEIIKKIESLFSKRGRSCDEESILSFFKLLIENLPDFYKHKNLTKINSGFSEIIEEIKTKKDGRKKQSPVQSSRQRARDWANSND